MTFITFIICFLVLFSSQALASCSLEQPADFSLLFSTLFFLYGAAYLIAAGVDYFRSMKAGNKKRAVIFLITGIAFASVPFLIAHSFDNEKMNSLVKTRINISSAYAASCISLLATALLLIKKPRHFWAALPLMPVIIIGLVLGHLKQAENYPLCCKLPKAQHLNGHFRDLDYCPSLCVPCGQDGKALKDAPLTHK